VSNPKKHSFSRISTFSEICERRGAFDSLIPREWDSAPIKRGNHVHDMLERMALLMIEGDTAVQAAEAVAESKLCTEGYLKPNVAANYLQRAVPVFEHLKPRKEGVEAWFRDVSGLPIVGKIDLISETTPLVDPSGYVIGSVDKLCILDHKTIGNPARMKGTYEAKKSLQLKIYCLATGARNAGFIYYLPTGAVRVVVVEFTEAELDIARTWLDLTLKTINRRWEEAAALSGRETGAPEVEGFNLLPFSLAEPGHPLCNAKFCDHWDRCLGRKADNSSSDKD